MLSSGVHVAGLRCFLMPKDLKHTKIVIISASYMFLPILANAVLHKFVFFDPDLPSTSRFPLFFTPSFSEVGFGLFVLTALLTPKHYIAGVMLLLLLLRVKGPQAREQSKFILT